ncbi:MAG TPA: YIP1 family protein [archaeon]|nr:YIP1 family protein [archaeon]
MTWNIIKQVLFEAERYIDSKTMDTGGLAKLIVVSSLVPAIIGALVALGISISGIQPYSGFPLGDFLGSLGAGTIVISFIGVIIGAVLALFIGGAVLHAFALLVGANKEYNDTLAALSVGLVPALVLGWIPVVNVFVGVYAGAALVYALARKQGLNLWRASIAVSLPAVIIGLIIYIGIAFTTPDLLQLLLPQLSL